VPYADPKKQRAANREAQRRHRAKQGLTVESLVEAVRDADSLPTPPSRDVLLRALGVQALEGNVPAIRLLLEEYRRDGDNEVPTSADPIDELAPRRASRTG
jgi:hypothetical protein